MPSLTGIDSVADLASNVIDKIWPDKGEAERQQLAATVAIIQGQLKVNEAEAANPSIFTSGWRPFIGWVCGSALVYHYIARPLLPWVLAVLGVTAPTLPGLDMGDLFTVLGTMLGMGSLRSFDKKNGVAS